MLKPVSAALVVCLSSPSFAAEGSLSATEIRKLVAGTLIELDAPLGHRLPVEYAEDGRLAGQARGLASHMGSANDTGRWWVEANKLCHRWERWFDGETQCLELSRQGGRVHWRNAAGNSGTATIVSKLTAVAQAGPANEPDGPAIQFTRPRAPAMPETPAAPAARTPAPAVIEFDTSAPAPPAALRKPALEGRMQAGAPPLVEPRPDAKQVLPPKLPAPPPALQADPKAPPQTRSQSGPASAAFKVANVAAADVLNVRSGPSPEHDIVGSLTAETRGVHMTGACQSRWCPIEHKSLTGWVNRAFLSDDEEKAPVASAVRPNAAPDREVRGSKDAPEAPRSCLSPEASALLGRIEARFGPVRAVSTCRPGARIAGTGRMSRHASGNAIDFDAGSRKDAVVEWLVANHVKGGTMTYPSMDHIHIDIGPHFVSLASGRRIASRARTGGDRMSLVPRN